MLEWDHVIKLQCKPSPGFRKVYLMTFTEQKEMDTFLEEALATGHIRQSKLLLGALLCFIKKDGKLVRGHRWQSQHKISM
jgi:hypothetical protein